MSDIDELRERAKLFIKAIPIKDRQKKVTDVIQEVSQTKSNGSTEIGRKELDEIFPVEVVVMAAIAKKNGQSIERIIYDLSSSYYSQKNTSEDAFKYPSDLPASESILDVNESEYIKNIPTDIIIDEGTKNEFRDNLLGQLEGKKDKLLDLLKNMKKKPV